MNQKEYLHLINHIAYVETSWDYDYATCWAEYIIEKYGVDIPEDKLYKDVLQERGEIDAIMHSQIASIFK